MIQINSSVIDGLVGTLRYTVEREGFSRVVLGMSGGIDSALSCNLAVLAFGRENVFTYSMPYRLSSLSSREDAAFMAEHLGVSLETVDITAMAEAYPDFAALDAHRLGNVLARLRMITLFDKSAEKNALVQGTGNKTEILLGYSTWFGDTACSVNPLGDMYKTQVYEASKLLGIPERLINKAPSADLREGQTDEGDFGHSYADIDRFLDAYHEEKAGEAYLISSFGRELVKDISGRMNRNHYKSKLPVIAGIGQRPID